MRVDRLPMLEIGHRAVAGKGVAAGEILLRSSSSRSIWWVWIVSVPVRAAGVAADPGGGPADGRSDGGDHRDAQATSVHECSLEVGNAAESRVGDVSS